MVKPKTINIFGKIYRFEYLDLEDQNIDGEHKAKLNKIIIDKNLKGKELTHTILHELGHALFHRMGWRQAIPHEVEEIVVDTFATFLVDNDLVK